MKVKSNFADVIETTSSCGHSYWYKILVLLKLLLKWIVLSVCNCIIGIEIEFSIM